MSQPEASNTPTVMQVMVQMMAMEQQINRLSAQTQELKEENDQLKAEAAGRPATPFPHLLPPSPAPRAPENQAGVEVRAFLDTMRLIITAEPKRPKAQVPPPNPHNGKKDTLNQFIKECNEWLMDNKVLNEQSRI
jgi:hypothetical protein